MPRDNKLSYTIESREGNGVNPYASIYRDKVTDFVGLVHSSLLKWVSENEATDANKGEHNGPGTGCKQNDFCGIREHLNPPSRHA